MKIGLALGGGSSKGLAHIGVLEVLEEENIPIDLICGTSIGAVVGGLYSLNPDVSLLKKKAEEVLSSDSFKEIGFSIFSNDKKSNLFERITTFIKEKYSYGRALFRPFIVDGEKIERLLEEIFNEKRFEDTKISFSVTAIDIVTGNDIIINSGPIIAGVSASIAMPGLFPYIKKDNYLLVDGGATQDIPVMALKKMGADIVIASNVSSPPEPRSNFRTGLEINFRVDEIAKHRLIERELDEADIVIAPNLRDLHWADYRKIALCIQRGREATRKVLPEIKRKTRKTIFHRLKEMFRR